MARRRKTGPRTNSGKLSRAHKRNPELRDMGTEQAQAKRQALVGNGADPTMSSTMPGILFARQHLTLDQYLAAMDYRLLRCALLGPPWPANGSGKEPSDRRIAKLQEKFDRVCSLLTLIQKQVISNVAVHDKPPMWFCRQARGDRLRVVDEFERRTLIEGLNALVSGRRVKVPRTNLLQTAAVLM
jgi:hypothetical protein